MTLFSSAELEGEVCGRNESGPQASAGGDPARTGEGTPLCARPSGSADEKLYHSPLGILPHQVEGVAHVLAQAERLIPASFGVWDTGLGKTHLDMISTAMLVEEGLIDLALVVCEGEKVTEWMEDFARFTKLRVCKYQGKDPKARGTVRANLGDWDVLVATYETFRNDMAVKSTVVTKTGRRSKKLTPGPLTEACMGLRVKIAWDEINKLAGRGTDNHKAHDLFCVTVAKSGGHVIKLGLTATPIETGADDAYNVGRILIPDRMPTVATFEEHYVARKDAFGNYADFKNLVPEKMSAVYDKAGNPVEVTPFRDLFSGIMLRKSKNDPDVREFFPPVTEEFEYVTLGEKHQSFYETVVNHFADADEMTQRALFMTLRMIAGHPMSLLQSEGKVGRTIVDAVGAAGLAALGCVKLDRLLHYLVPVVKSGQQAIVFTFFGPSIGPLIAEGLEAKHVPAARFYGPDRAAKDAAKAAFRAGDARVLVSSDAGSRGLNLPEATYVVNYEMPLTHARYVQRQNRAVRLGEPGQPPVTVQSFVAIDTVEDGIVNLGHRRNQWSDQMFDSDRDEIEDDTFLSAEQRRKIMRWSRKQVA